MINTGAVRAHEELRPATRGRPPRLSRDSILDTCILLLEQEPTLPVSLNAVARSLKVTPVALYTYFPNKNALLQALTERLLEDLTIDYAGTSGPCARITLWAHTMRRHFLKRPQLIDMLVWEGGHTSISWLGHAMAISDALGEMGLAGEELAATTLWVWHVVMSAILADIRHQSSPIDVATVDLKGLDPDFVAKVELLRSVAAAPSFREDFFGSQIERLVAGLRTRTMENATS